MKQILSFGSHFGGRFIPDREELRSAVDSLKKAGYKIVLTQGVFDLLHIGHALYLEQARSYGDILVVAVDTDSLTRSRKGPRRPIVPEKERIETLVHLRYVDIITLLDEGDPRFVAQTIHPDVWVFSRSTSDISEQDVENNKKYCGEVVYLPPQAETSTTARIRKLMLGTAGELADVVTKAIQNYLDGLGGQK
jgi:D-beta-D-heptose 7-phosphate kinase/D-beta-D-heptose 1-phosphate adenosyltransferase